MKLYRFSPISSESELLDALRYVHEASHKLCKEVTGMYLPVRGDIGIFCHDYGEFTYLTELRKKLTNAAPNYNGKYFPLKQSITFPEKDGVPAAMYTYLYIRQVDPYRSQVGDVDFVMSPEVFERYKMTLQIGEFRSGARLFERPDENMIELWNPENDVLAYIAINDMNEAVQGKNVDIAGVVVRDEAGRYLMVQEKRSDVYGKWNVPAGRVDAGETPQQGAAREAYEETGYEVELLSETPLLHEQIQSAGRDFYIYHAKVVGGEKRVDPSEALDVAWLTYERICELHKNGELRADVMFRAITKFQNQG